MLELEFRSGCKNLAGLWCSAFTSTNIKHCSMNLKISLVVPFHQKDSLISWYILVLSGWFFQKERCAFSRINLFIPSFSSRHILHLNLNIPSSYTWNSEFTPLSISPISLTIPEPSFYVALILKVDWIVKLAMRTFWLLVTTSILALFKFINIWGWVVSTTTVGTIDFLLSALTIILVLLGW